MAARGRRENEMRGWIHRELFSLGMERSKTVS